MTFRLPDSSLAKSIGRTKKDAIRSTPSILIPRARRGIRRNRSRICIFLSSTPRNSPYSGSKQYKQNALLNKKKRLRLNKLQKRIRTKSSFCRKAAEPKRKLFRPDWEALAKWGFPVITVFKTIPSPNIPLRLSARALSPRIPCSPFVRLWIMRRVQKAVNAAPRARILGDLVAKSI